MGVLNVFREAVGDDSVTLRECRNCGKKLAEGVSDCQNCGAEEIARYEF